MTDQEDNMSLGEIVSDNNNQVKKSGAYLGQTCFKYINVFLSQRFVILSIVFRCFWTIHLLRNVTNPLFLWEVCVVHRDIFYPHQDYEQLNF